jgi:hypothetical protein
MKHTERQDLLIKMAKFIRQERTGNPEEFARKCGMKSKDILFYHINILRELVERDGVRIVYDRDLRTYCFSPRGQLSDFKFIKDD